MFDGPSILAMQGLSEPFLRRAIGAATGFLSGGPAGAIAGALAAGGGGSKAVPGNTAKRAPIDRCVPGDCSSMTGTSVVSTGSSGRQVTVTPSAFLPGGDPFVEVSTPAGGGQTVGGRYGAGVLPAERQTSTSVCPRGMVLGNDGVCYPKRSIRNSDRMYPRGRKPLLTGGDLNAISRASRAAKKMKVQQKRLQKLGLLAKPKPRSRSPRPAVVVSQRVDD